CAYHGPVAEILWSFALPLVALACAGFSVVRSLNASPSAFAKRCLSESVAMTKARESEVALFSAQREAWMVEFSSIADRCDETLERAESKRRRVAGQESKARAAAPPEPAEMTREQIVDHYRRQARGMQ
ncbi:unnamed protein product, partial [marine sediment metagenome]